MNTATKVGEIFTKAAAGDSYNKIGDMIIMLAPAAHELIAIDEKNAIYYDVSLQNINPQFLIVPYILDKFCLFQHHHDCSSSAFSATTTTNCSTSQWKRCIGSTTIRITASNYTYA